MKTITPAQAEHQLTRVADRFADWRQSRTTPTEPIPHHLWEYAIALTALFSIARVATRLGISGQELQQRCAAQHPAPTVASPPPLGFVEVPAVPTWPVPATSIEIELQRPDGTRMRMHTHESQIPLTALVRAFLETS
jgi:hypothetical protein